MAHGLSNVATAFAVKGGFAEGRLAGVLSGESCAFVRADEPHAARISIMMDCNKRNFMLPRLGSIFEPNNGSTAL